MCLEFVSASVGTNYGSRTIEVFEEAGFVPASSVDPRYGTIKMARQCHECNCRSGEECLTLQDLGFACETTTAAGGGA